MKQANAMMETIAATGGQPMQQAGQIQQPGADNPNSELNQIIQQVSQLKTALHNFVEQEGFPDARVITASGVLEAHLNSYYRMMVDKENMKPGLETF